MDDLLEIGSEGMVPDIRVRNGNDKLSASMFDLMVKEEPLCEDDLRDFQKDRVKKDNHNQSKFLSFILLSKLKQGARSNELR